MPDIPLPSPIRLYELVPAGYESDASKVDALKYQHTRKATDRTNSNELLTLKLRYKKHDGHRSKKLEFPITDAGKSYAQASGDFKFASAVAEFGMLLRKSPHRGAASFDAVLELAEEGRGVDRHGYRQEFIGLVKTARGMQGRH